MNPRILRLISRVALLLVTSISCLPVMPDRVGSQQTTAEPPEPTDALLPILTAPSPTLLNASPAAPTATPSPDIIPPSQVPVVPNIISQTKLGCSPQGDFLRCKDPTLKIDFEYPAIWGGVEGILRKGETGFAYYYIFSANGNSPLAYIQTGGRSRDFTEGRGGWRTDFPRPEDGPNYDPCQSGDQLATICEAIKPQVFFLMRFPEAQYVCVIGPESFSMPFALIDVSLPDNATIYGFRFVIPFLSEYGTEDFLNRRLGILGSVSEVSLPECDSANWAAFDESVQEFIAMVRSGSVDDDTRNNIERLRHIAESINIE